ncbi:pseudouridine synthase [Xylaria bambusicola]|uniref:pseudouridine synthase n=1 Tax=Xylaria bambusicola TaxID=326684 RepID=UPI002007771D|nr:pseudouridine synthase [Xylaria bambusicola]KAI0525477.1 pseudouridine synthase [Xylaria bambusicola]
MAASGTASTSILDGVFGINKPIGMSSAQVIRDCQHHFNPSATFKPMVDREMANRSSESNNKRKRRGFGKNDIRVKMGHGGTLDPLATGVLILGVGKGTKSLQSFLDCTKTYETVVLFGASTDTYDRVGKILKKTTYDHITRPLVEEALKSFRGKYQQMPPLYSALKMEGKPLYEYAREGKPIPREIATREVNVSDLELVEWYEPGTHSHRWPSEEATSFERGFAEQVWKVEKDQMESKKLTPEEEEADAKARNEHENFKRKADESVDALVFDRLNKRKKGDRQKDNPMMSGALGELPPAAPKPGKGSNLIPETPESSTPPWDGKGPPAARIRMTVTSGFYVRSFCHDLGVKVSSSAMMAELCRSRQGDFILGSSNCLEFADLAKGEEVWGSQVKEMLEQWNRKGQTTATQAPLRAKENKSPLRNREPNDSPRRRSRSPSARMGSKSPAR